MWRGAGVASTTSVLRSPESSRTGCSSETSAGFNVVVLGDAHSSVHFLDLAEQ